MKKILLSVISVFLCASILRGAGQYSITMFVVRPPFDINFSSPRHLMISFASNAFGMYQSVPKYNMGHVYVSIDGPESHVITGSSRHKSSRTGWSNFIKGYGLGMLFCSFPGRLDDEQKINFKIASRYRDGSLSFIRFIISKATYDRVMEYYKEYLIRTEYQFYNGENKPREGLGAGCTAYAISFLQVAGLLNDEFEPLWAQAVRVPTELVGGPLTGHKVSGLKILASRRWAAADEPHFLFKIYDPLLMHNWIKKVVQNRNDRISFYISDNHALSACPFERIKIENSPGLIFDCRNITTPDEPIFLVPGSGSTGGSAK